MISSVTTKGQVVIPSRLRRKYGIKIGTKIYFEEDKDGIKLYPVTENIIEKNMGMLGTQGKLLKKLLEEKKTEKEL